MMSSGSQLVLGLIIASKQHGNETLAVSVNESHVIVLTVTLCFVRIESPFSIDKTRCY